MSAEKRTVKVNIRVFYATVRTGWSTSALILEDNSGDIAPRKVTLQIESPSDIAYLRERLNQIEEAWQKQLNANRAHV